MYDRRVPQRMMDVLRKWKDRVRLVVILRDPVARAYSGLDQQDETATPEVFHDIVSKEIDVIKTCYSVIFVNEERCHSAEEHYAALKQCVDERIDDGRPWFERFTAPLGQEYRGQINRNGHSYWLHEGLLLRGIYVDQLKAFLCAGWDPEQIFITTTTFLHEKPLKLAKQLASFVDPDASVLPPFKKRLRSGDQLHRGSAAGSKPQMLPETEKLLRDFFEGHNEALVHFLKQHNFLCNIEHIEKELGLLVRTQAEQELDQDDDANDDDDMGADHNDDDDDDDDDDQAI